MTNSGTYSSRDKNFLLRNSKLSGTPLWFCAQVHGRVADDVITSHETATA